MVLMINKLTNVIFVFNKEQSDILTNIQANSSTRSDFRTWTQITICLPLLTFLVAVGFNFLLAPSCCYIRENWLKFLLNGSIPIISFGIISSGVSYLMETLNTDLPSVQSMRKRVMGIALMFLFLTSVLYIFQSVPFISDGLRPVQSGLVLVVSVVVCMGSISIGRKMYLLQKSMIEEYYKGIQDVVVGQTSKLTDRYGDGE